VDELLHFVEKSSGVKRDKIYHYVNEMSLDIKEHLHKSFFALSGGMKQKLLIGISAAKESSIYIYDEPTANLDPKAREKFYKILKEQKDSSISLFVTHRIEEVQELVNREIYMDLGEIVSDARI
jgi:ABC-2 type transport system ATP-binding protein